MSARRQEQGHESCKVGKWMRLFWSWWFLTIWAAVHLKTDWTKPTVGLMPTFTPPTNHWYVNRRLLSVVAIDLNTCCCAPVGAADARLSPIAGIARRAKQAPRPLPSNLTAATTIWWRPTKNTPSGIPTRSTRNHNQMTSRLERVTSQMTLGTRSASCRISPIRTIT